MLQRTLGHRQTSGVESARIAPPTDDEAFWTIIAKFSWTKPDNGDAVLAPAVKVLAKLPVEDITAFDDLLAAKLFALDGEAFAREIGAEAFRRRGEYFAALAVLCVGHSAIPLAHLTPLTV